MAPSHLNRRPSISWRRAIIILLLVVAMFLLGASILQLHRNLTPHSSSRKREKVHHGISIVEIENEVKLQLRGAKMKGNPPTTPPPETATQRKGQRNGETKHSLLFGKADELGPLLRHALRRNNKDNLDLDSDVFAHGNEHPNEAPAASTLAGWRHWRTSPEIQVLDTMNSSEFYAAISGSEPTVVRGQSDDWCTSHEWTLDFIKRLAGDDVVGVETSQSNRFYSNAGLQKVQMRVADFLNVFTSPNRTLDYYLAEEGLEGMPNLLDDLRDPDFAEHAQIDKRQIWVGAGGQVSPLHHDQWDNVLCQVKGTRLFTLFDPLQVDRLYPKPGVDRHFSQLDPENVNLTQFPKFAKARKYTVKVSPGEMLIVPAFWWHQVRHAPEVNVAVNFWFTPSSLLAELLYDILLPDGPNN